MPGENQMAGSVNVGSIIYEVDIDTARLLASRREVDAAINGMSAGMGRLEASVNRTERSVASIERTMSGLTNVAKSVTAALSVSQVAAWGNEWVTVNNKLANSVRANEQLADVTQRVFDVSQNTRSGLAETAALYARLERATKSAGTSTGDLVKLVETINQGLAVSGATTEEASSTMIQLSQALASGVLRGEEFNSISENGSRLAVALADSLGVTVGQLRAMAAQGKLTTDVVVNGLLKQSDQIGKEFANTTLTMGQAFTVATNNITKFVGESTSVSTSIRVFNDGVISLSQNLDVVANAVALAAVIFGGRFAGALALATKSRVEDAMAARAQSVATAQAAAAAENAARVTAIKAALDKDMALSNLAVAQTEYNVARGTAAEALALDNLIAVKSIAVQRSAAYAEAQLAQAAATRAATAAAASSTTVIGSLARGALGLIGGPVGVATIAAAGLFYFYQKMQQAKQESIDFADKLGGVISQMNEMNQIQLKGTLADVAESIKNQKEQLDELSSGLEDARDNSNSFQKQLEGLKGLDAPTETIAKAQADLSDALREVDRQAAKVDQASQKLATTQQYQTQIQDTLNKKITDSDAAFNALAEKLSVAIPNASRASIAAIASTIQVIDSLNKKVSGVSAPAEPALSPQAQDLIKNAQRRLQLSKLEGEARAKLQAQYDADDAGLTDQKRVSALQEEYAETYRVTEARKESNKEGKTTATTTDSIAQKLERLKDQSELASDSTANLSRQQTILNAQQSLGKGATQTQIDLAGQYAAKKWDTANALKAQAAAEKLLPENKENSSYKQDVQDLNTAFSAQKISQEQYNKTSEQLEQQHQANLAKIRADAAVTPQQQAAGTVDPVQQLANENAQKLALIQQFTNQKVITEQAGLALMNAANTEYEQARTAAMWEQWKNQSEANQILASGFESLAGNASNALTGIVTGSMSAQEAMQSLASNALNSLINGFVQMGVEWVKSAITGAAAQSSAVAATTAAQTAGLATTTAASVTSAATTTAAWTPAALVASIGSFGGAAAIGLGALVAAFAVSKALSGKRKNGGPVSAGSMYQVGEGGMPEIYKASNGSQYMIPGDNGSVISNKDLQGSNGTGGVVINIQNYTSSTVDAQASNGTGGVTVDIIVADLDQGGPIRRAITRNTTATARATE